MLFCFKISNKTNIARLTDPRHGKVKVNISNIKREQQSTCINVSQKIYFRKTFEEQRNSENINIGALRQIRRRKVDFLTKQDIADINEKLLT